MRFLLLLVLALYVTAEKKDDKEEKKADLSHGITFLCVLTSECSQGFERKSIGWSSTTPSVLQKTSTSRSSSLSTKHGAAHAKVPITVISVPHSLSRTETWIQHEPQNGWSHWTLEEVCHDQHWGWRGTGRCQIRTRWWIHTENPLLRQHSY